MNSHIQYAYVQSRLCARQGLRPDESVWQHLQAQTGLAAYLLSARKTVLRPWVLALHADDHYHILESELLQQYQRYIEQVAQWLPAWSDAVRWAWVLMEIPALQFLLDGRTAPQWMLNHAELKLAGAAGVEQRIAALSQTAFFPLIKQWQAGVSLIQAWLNHWYALWPPMDQRSLLGIQALVQVLQEHKRTFAQSESVQAQSVRLLLLQQLTAMFHRYTFQPAATFIHLALVALDLERLRGDIQTRRLFSHIKDRL